jgi:hypothetical protein
MVFRGVVSTTMIYDERPVFGPFCYVNDNLIAGIMKGNKLGETAGVRGRHRGPSVGPGIVGLKYRASHTVFRVVT